MSVDYQNSILWRGEDPLKKKFKASYDATKKVTRYFPGKAPAWAEEEKKKKEEAKDAEEDIDIVPRHKKRRDKQAAAVVAEVPQDRGAARLRRLQASESTGDTGAERLLRHRVVHDAQVLEASVDGGEDISSITDRIKEKLRGKLADKKLDDFKEDKEYKGVEDVKELKAEEEDEDEDLDIERPVKSEVKSEVKAELKEEPEDEDAVADRRQKARELALQKRKQEEERLQQQQQEEELAQEEDDEESEYETESDEDDPRRAAMLKPVFVSKAQRDTVKEKEALEKEEEEAEKRREQKLKERKAESKTQVIDMIKMDAEAEAAAAAGVDDASDIELIDDNDEVNEAEEYELWKIRELKRIKRDTAVKMERLQEIEFIEKRRQMTDEERAADDERLDAGHKFKSEAKNFNFMQKYYHRGTFFQDKAEAGEEPLYLRDYHEPVADEKFDKTTLPKVMQVRRGMFGKKGQTKHTHLTDVDTTDMSAAWSQHNKQVQRYQERMAGASGVNNFARPSGSKSAS